MASGVGENLRAFISEGPHPLLSFSTSFISSSCYTFDPCFLSVSGETIVRAMEAVTSTERGSRNEKKVPTGKSKFKMVRKATAPKSHPYAVRNTQDDIVPKRREKLCKVDVLSAPMPTLLQQAKVAKAAKAAKAALAHGEEADTVLPKIQSFAEYSLRQEVQWWFDGFKRNNKTNDSLGLDQPLIAEA